MRGQLDRVAIDRNAARARIEVHRAAPEFARRMASGAPQESPQPGKDFLDMERFGDVIVGPCIKTLNLVAPAVARGQNQDRHGAPGPAPFTEHGNPVLLGQAQIQDDGVVRLRVAEKPALLAVESAVDGIARLRKRRHDLTIEILVILDDEQPHALIPCFKKRTMGKHWVMAAKNAASLRT